MPQFRSVITRTALLLVGLAASGAAQTRPPAETQVRAVVEKYLHGLKFNDVASFKVAFWPDARLFFVKRDSTLGQMSQEEWYKNFVSSAGKEEAGTLGIVSVNVTDNAASAKILETYPTSVYTDYLNLLRINGEWKIVNKIYTSRKR